MKNSKFGFELEAYTEADELLSCGDCEYCENCILYENIYNDLIDSGLSAVVNGVKGDGSLDYGGFEINSEVFSDFKSMKNNLIDLILTLKDSGYYGSNPAAIHLHCSDIYKPLGFYYSAFRFDRVFSGMLSNTGYRLINRTKPVSELLEPELLKTSRRVCINENFSFREALYNSGISSGRENIIRNRGSTLEFRPIPTRFNLDYIEIILKIYKEMIKIGNRDSVESLFKKAVVTKSSSLKYQLAEFKKVFNLTNEEIFIFSNRINSETEEKLYQLKEATEEPIDYYRGFIVPDSPIIDISQLGDIETEYLLESDWSRPILDRDRIDHRVMHNLLVRHRGYNLANEHFRFSETPIEEIYAFCIAEQPEIYPRI